MSKLRPTLIAYTQNVKGFPEFEQFRVEFSNPTFFQVPSPKGKYEYFYTDSKVVRESYKILAPWVKEFIPESKQKVVKAPISIESQIQHNLAEQELEKEPEQEIEVVEIPDNFAELKWKDLRALALKFTDEVQISKDRAIEILTQAKGA